MEILFIVMVGAFLIIMIAKAIFSYGSYKKSIYRSLYSIYPEYFFKYEIRQDCSKSSWLQSQIGSHRLFFSQILDNNGKAINHFVTILYEKGIVLISFLNPNGALSGKTKDTYWVVTRKEKDESRSFRIANPIHSLLQYKARLSEILNRDDITCMISIHDSCDISNLKLHDMDITYYKDIVNYLKQSEDKNQLTTSQINDLFQKLKG